MSRLPPTRPLLLVNLLITLLFVSHVYSIPFSTVLKRTTSIWKRPFASHRHDYYYTSRIPPFLQKQQQKPSSVLQETVHSLFGGFAESSLWKGRKSSSLSSTIKEETVTSSNVVGADAVSITPPTESAHLKLGSEQMLPKNNNNHEKKQAPPTSILYTYHDTIHNITLSGLNVSKRKFSAWVNHTLHTTTHQQDEIVFNSSYITSRQVLTQDLAIRQELRHLWKCRELLTDRTEVLAVYKSEQQEQYNDCNENTLAKRGGFADLLHIYAERLSAIIQDEVEEFQISFCGQVHVNRTGIEGQVQISPCVLNILQGGLLGWLQRDYGINETQELLYENLRKVPIQEQYATFQHFLEWFRSNFPYYYDRCDSCGASAKDDPEIECIDDNGTNAVETDTSSEQQLQQQEEDDDDNGTFLGYVYPSNQELLGKASRTEIYQCHKCGSFTRFPRYNAASSVIQNRRGRCGEYSMLLYRILRATGHTCRWIVDWSDHVWSEVLLGGKWIHLDPCEAAVNKPLLYEEWGKQQTYIVAFHAPLAAVNGGAANNVPLIEDVTLRYTSADKEQVRKRRDESDDELAEFVDQTIVDLKEKLERILNR